jgi:ABC-2 type transport system permease protein
MNQTIRSLKAKYRYTSILLIQLVKTDFKLRYQNSVLGYVWSLLRPMALFLTLYVVFVKFLDVGNAVPNFAIYLLLGIVLWNFFAEITVGNVSSIVGKGDMMRKLSFPRYTVVLASSISALINLAINLVVVAFFMVYKAVPVRVEIVFLPLLLLELYLFSLAVAFFLSAMYVRLRDTGYVWEVIMQGAFYATPILYPVSRIVEKSPLAAKILLLSPVAQVIQDARYVTVTDHTVTLGKLYGGNIISLLPIALTIFSLVGASVFFRVRSRSFAEEI